VGEEGQHHHDQEGEPRALEETLHLDLTAGYSAAFSGFSSPGRRFPAYQGAF
jgi:hypothetical protein